MFKITIYGVHSNEVNYFKRLNKYNYKLNLISTLLTHENIETAKGSDAVLLRANCIADEQNLLKLNKWGIKYVFTRTVGIDHINLETAAKLNLKVARVPAYSPYAVAELVITLGMMLFRHTATVTNNTHIGNFAISPENFSKEINSSVIGIIGTGKIGITEASLYKGMGAKVLGYDPYPTAKASQYVDFVTQDELLSKADIVSLHVPYFPGQNDNLVNSEFLEKMKSDSFLVNTARGELVDNIALIQALREEKLAGFATDVFRDEGKLLGRIFKKNLPDPTLEELRELYPKVLITPHIGSYTSPALMDMVKISYDNFHQVLTEGYTDNDVKLPSVLL
ncbi:NAD(P)-dependent oxidoreductase [Liquorilactobacillus hordei]|uniref:NAD(P)-dependent oxidoreductase n=1 Tax=Liquorilactobacillus hordei TaxID=468911 RepID=UPI0039E83D76